MKMCWCVMLLITTSVAAFAGWQVSTPQNSIPREPFFQTGGGKPMPPAVGFTPITQTSAVPDQFALSKPKAVYAVSISGSLKENIERIMGRYHWRVLWKAPYDYNFDGRITGTSLSNVLDKLIQPFPLKAEMYMSNRTLVIRPRYKS